MWQTLKKEETIEKLNTNEKQGLTEEDALLQARVARILRDGEYDYNKEEVVLWKP